MLDLKEFARKNTKTAFGKEYCYIKAQENISEKLLIVLSAHNQFNKFFLFRSFVENLKYDMLFLTDNNTWYLDDDFGLSYELIIKDYINIYKKENIVIFGSSMGGYGAVCLATKFGTNCLLCNPQIDLPISYEWGWNELRLHLREIINSKKYIDVVKELEKSRFNNIYFVIYGHNPIDEINVNLLMTSCKCEKKLIVFQYDGDDHNFPFDRDVNLIYQCIDLIYSVTNLNIKSKGALPEIKELRESRRRNDFYAPYEFNREYINRDLWTNRSQIKQSGIYNFIDVGIWAKSKYSGLLMYRDENGCYHLIAPPGIKENRISFFIKTNLSL